jgi:PAS domain S-box-containing protein
MNKPVRILLVDDDEDDYLLTSDLIKEIPTQQFDIQWSPNYADAVTQIKKCNHEVYIFDFFLGVKTGLDLLNFALSIGCQEPIILLTGKGDQQIDEEAMKLGAVDYLVKPDLSAEVLERSIRYALNQADILKALKSSESKFRTIFEQSSDLVFIIDMEGNFMQTNASASALLHYNTEEIRAMKFVDLWENREEHAFFERLMDSQRYVKGWEITLLTKQKERKYCLLSATLQYDTQNKPYHQGIIHDITQRKKAERDLMIAEKMAATGRLVRTLAHEVRNPLTNINLAMEELEENVKEEELTLYLDIVKRGSQRINDLINELLNSSKPSEVRKVQVSIEKIVTETLELAHDRLQLKNIALEEQFTAGDCLVVALDAEKIKIALLNIVINAIEAMEENTGVMKVKVFSTDAECIVSIEDNGSGISPENMNRLFEPYFTSKSTGVGLGLAATLNIIQSHNGRIEVDSEVGKGTKFTIYFNL